MSNDSTRTSLEHWTRQHAHIRVIDNPGKIVSTGLNAAIREARSEFILRMDMHTEYAPDYIKTCLEEIQRTGADSVGGPWRARGKGWISRGIAAAFQSPFGSGWARGHDLSYEGYVDTVYLGCWRKSLLERLGLFDEVLVRNQDDELHLRIIRAGGKVWQSPRIVSWYTPRNSLYGLFRQYFQYGFWKIPVIRKHKLPASVRHLIPGLFVTSNVILLLGAALLTISPYPQWGSWLFMLWMGVAGSYAAVCLAASFATACKYGWTLLPVLPIVLSVYHCAYGIGFMTGILCWSSKQSSATNSSVFTEITR
jgi:succinoglycan biosynthesis protein ExoA